MRLLLVILLIGTVSAGFFDFLSGKKKEEVIHETAPDTGELGANIENGNQGRRVALGKESRSLNRNEGDEIVIPVNGGSNKASNNKVTTPTTPRRFTTERMETFDSTTPRAPPTTVTRTLPSDDQPHKASCPWRVDAFTETPQDSLLFDGTKVYFIQGTWVSSSQEIAEAFPRGPKIVNAAVYDKDKDLVVLFKDRQVLGYKMTGPTSFALDSSYPKDLPDSISFTPNAAIRWHDDHQMLLSSGGMFSLYDEYWNKSLMSGRTSSYFKGLPDRVRGISFWSGGRSTIFTQNLVFTYDQNRSALVDDGMTLGRYLKC